MTMGDWEPLTQQPTAEGKWVDIIMECGSEWAVVVEVKVRQPEDGEQIRGYKPAGLDANPW